MVPTALLLFAISVAKPEATRSLVHVDDAIANLVTPIIQAAASSRSAGDNEQGLYSSVYRKLPSLLDHRNRKTDEALVVLLGFDLGESANGDIACELVARGPRMLPILRRFQNANVVFPRFTVPSSVPRWNAIYGYVIEQIERRQKCMRDVP